MQESRISRKVSSASESATTSFGVFYAWLPLPREWSADQFAVAARGRGILVTPRIAFAVSDGAPRSKPHLKLRGFGKNVQEHPVTLKRLQAPLTQKLFKLAALDQPHHHLAQHRSYEPGGGVQKELGLSNVVRRDVQCSEPESGSKALRVEG